MYDFEYQIADRDYDQIKEFKAYDDRYAAPIHGFRNAEDDPFLGASCYPYHEKKSPYIYLEVPKYGGHVGLMNRHINSRYWSESRTVDFIQEFFKTIG